MSGSSVSTRCSVDGFMRTVQGSSYFWGVWNPASCDFSTLHLFRSPNHQRECGVRNCLQCDFPTLGVFRTQVFEILDFDRRCSKTSWIDLSERCDGERKVVKMKIENKLYTVAETAEILRTGQARVREYVRDGILQSRRHGRRILILGISIARYLGITLDENGKENTREELSRT
jgi:hypothetical protein